MKLNLNSVTARLYRWFYTTYDMPQSLCPYFWKLAIMWTFIIPYSAVALPTLFSKDERYKMIERFFFGMFLWMFLFVGLICLTPITYFFVGWLPETLFIGAAQRAGLVGDLVVAVVCILFGIIYLIKRAYDRKHQRQREMIWKDGQLVPNPDYQPKRPNLIVEFIKATYNKYCPKIDWN